MECGRRLNVLRLRRAVRRLRQAVNRRRRRHAPPPHSFTVGYELNSTTPTRTRTFLAKLRWVRAGPFRRKKSPCPCRARVRVVEFSSYTATQRWTWVHLSSPNPNKPTMLTRGPNPTHPSHTYVKCRRQYCRTHIFTCPLFHNYVSSKIKERERIYL